MKTIPIISFILWFSVCSATAQTKPQKFEYPATVPLSLNISADRLIYIDRLLQEYVGKGIIPHALTFVAKNGVTIHNKAFGWSDIESGKALKKDDIFRIFSQTKAIASVALMTLFEQGKFQLDDPVSKYIPECTNLVLEKWNHDGTYTTRPEASPVTIRHLLSHTSGLMGSVEMITIWRNKRNENRYQTVADEVRDLIQFPLAFDPGTQWYYLNMAPNVCAYLVEIFSGQPFRDYVKESILIPLGMKDTDWYYPESYRERLVTAYNGVEGKLVARNNVWTARNPFQADIRYCEGGTGLYGTIEDYARFCQMLLNGGTFNGKRVLGRRTIEMMSVDQLPHPNNGGPDFHFGLGFQIYPDKETERKGVHRFTPMVTPGSLKWYGMYNTDFLIDPKEELIILLYTNCLLDTKIWEKFLNTVYQALN